MAAAETFVWGNNGAKLSPKQVESLRAIAEARATRPVATNLGEGLAALGDAFVVNANQGRANAAESEGQKLVADALAAKDWQGVIADPWASPGQRAVGSAMMDRGWQLEDRAANWAREDARAAQSRAAAAAEGAKPKWETIDDGQGNTYRWNANDPNSKPELFFDGPEAVPDPQSLINTGNGTIYDPNKQQWITNPDAPAAGGVDFDDISGVRKEVQGLPSYKNLAQATPIFNAMVETASRDSRASDLNLVYGLGKIMDPTSVVREGEMFMVQGINTLPDKVIEGVNSLLTGTSTLSPATREAILTEAYGRVKGYEDAFSTDSQSYKGLAERYKINPDDVLPGFEPLAPFTPPGAPVTITDDAGYDALPSGATFKAPDGSIRKKP